MTQLASLIDEIFRSWAYKILVWSFFMFLMLEALLLTLGNTALLPFVSFPIYNIPFINCKTGLTGFKQAVSLLSDLCNPSVTCLFDALLYVTSHLNACLGVTKASILHLNLKPMAQSITQRDTMDFVILFLHLPQIPIILSFAGTCIVLHGRMLIWSLSGVYFCKEQITKTELSGHENGQNFAEIDCCYGRFRLPCFQFTQKRTMEIPLRLLACCPV